MQAWAWLVAYVVGFGLLQVALYRYFQRSEPTPKTTEGRVDRGATSAPPSLDDGPGTVQACEHCGTANESHRMIRYCRDCAEPLR